MRLIALARANLQKNRVADLVKTELEDFCMDLIKQTARVNISLAKVEVGLEEGDGPILKTDIKVRTRTLMPNKVLRFVALCQLM